MVFMRQALFVNMREIREGQNLWIGDRFFLVKLYYADTRVGNIEGRREDVIRNIRQVRKPVKPEALMSENSDFFTVFD